MNRKIIIGALVVCLLALVTVFAFSQQSNTNVRWEYTSIDTYNMSIENFTTRANDLGRQGWELVGRDFPQDSDIVIFKRRP
jgi:hypothetical protein